MCGSDSLSSWLTEYHSWRIYPYGDRRCACKGVVEALQTNGGQTTATHCNTLQLKHTTTHCNCDTLQLQHTATPVNALQRTLSHHTGVWKESWKRNQQKTKKHLDAKKSHQTKMMRQMSKLRGACVHECVTWLVCVWNVTHSLKKRVIRRRWCPCKRVRVCVCECATWLIRVCDVTHL